MAAYPSRDRSGMLDTRPSPRLESRPDEFEGIGSTAVRGSLYTLFATTPRLSVMRLVERHFYPACPRTNNVPAVIASIRLSVGFIGFPQVHVDNPTSSQVDGPHKMDGANPLIAHSYYHTKV